MVDLIRTEHTDDCQWNKTRLTLERHCTCGALSNPSPSTQLRVTDEAVLVACRAHTPQFDRLDPEISKYAVAQMRAALHAALTAERMEAPHGWVCFNSGPTEWFWSEKREVLEHELSDDIRPATHLEKYFFNKQGNQTHEHDIAPPQTREAGHE